MDQVSFKKVSRRIVIELAVVIVLVSYKVNFPKNQSSSQAWHFVFKHPLVFLHIIVGTIIIIEAFVLLIRSVHSKNRLWSILTLIGLIFVLYAYASGEEYVAMQKLSAINDMSTGWVGAALAYGFGWYWGHKKASRISLVATPEGSSKK